MIATQTIEPRAKEYNPSADDFAALLNELLSGSAPSEGAVVKGKIVAIEKDLAVIDVGLKTEGRVPLKEFGSSIQFPTLHVGDEVEVYVERIENSAGEAVLSREKARREDSWTKLEQKFNAGEKVEGVIFNRVKGGFTVDLDGAVAFLPGSQVDIRPIKDVTPLMNVPQPFQILKMDRAAATSWSRAAPSWKRPAPSSAPRSWPSLRKARLSTASSRTSPIMARSSTSAASTACLHVTDMAWKRVNHPTEILNVGDTVKVQIVRINPETQRISLGMKQLGADPWSGIEAKYPIGGKFKGTVTNIADYGAFVELEPGVEGLIHVSEMSWVKKNVHPGKIVSTSQEVEVQVLEVDASKRRISLGLKQTQENPWNAFAESHPKGSIVEGQVRNITEFGLFVGLDGGIDGMVHLSDLDWQRSGEEAIKEYNKGDTVRAVVLETDAEKERISLGIKQLATDPFQSAATLKKGSTVTCEVLEVKEAGIDVKLAGTDVTAFIRRADFSRDRSEQRPERFARRRHGRCGGHPSRQERPQDRAFDQGARNRRGEGSRGAIRLDRQRRLSGGYSWRGLEQGSNQGKGVSRIAVRSGRDEKHGWRTSASPVLEKAHA